jgi:hypothetical protein
MHSYHFRTFGRELQRFPTKHHAMHEPPTTEGTGRKKV